MTIVKKLYIVLAAELVILLALGVWLNESFVQEHTRITMGERGHLARLIGQRFGDFISSARQDMALLADDPALREYLATSSPASLRALQERFLLMARTKRSYQQIRHIDEKGRETARVDMIAGQARLVPSERLQNKADRYYFAGALNLPPGEVFISQLDLNVENGRIERPLLPVIRLATAMRGPHGQPRGIVIINVNASDLMDFTKLAASETMMIIDGEGYYLHHPDPAKRWSRDFALEQARERGTPEPDALGEIPGFIQDHTAETFRAVNGLETMSIINGAGYISHPIKLSETARLTIVDRITPGVREAQLENLRHVVTLLFAVALILPLGMALWIIRSIRENELIPLLEQKNALLEDQHTQLEKMNRMKDQFIAILGHDLRAPLGSVITLLDQVLIRSADLPESQRQIVGRTSAIARNLISFIDSLLDLSLVNLGHDAVKITTVRLWLVAEAARTALEPLAAAKGVKIVNAIPGGMWAWGDEVKLQQIFCNLLSNGIKFSSNGAIRMSAERTGGMVALSVEDQGIGMNGAQAKALFDLARKTTTKGTAGEKGFGLGMQYCKEIIERLGGEISVTSEPGKGTRVSFTLPAAERAAVPEKAARGV